MRFVAFHIVNQAIKEIVKHWTKIKSVCLNVTFAFKRIYFEGQMIILCNFFPVTASLLQNLPQNVALFIHLKGVKLKLKMFYDFADYFEVVADQGQ